MESKCEVFKTFFGLIFKMEWDFVNIEESVREPYVPNLLGVQYTQNTLFQQKVSESIRMEILIYH